MAVQQKRFCLFNCDNTYDLKIVEEFLSEEDEKGKYKIHVDSLYFGLRRMTETVETTLPTLKMDCAIFVVHANESRLSINEDNAGIGYARIYKALLQATDDKVLIVIGGDSYYKDEDEEDRSVISRWARRKVASQFNEEYLDGRKSFIFSWDTKHRPIHEEALRHFLDPSKKEVKFVYTPKPKPLPRAPEREVTPTARDERGYHPVQLQRNNDNKGFRNDDEEAGSGRRLFSHGEGEGQKSELRSEAEEANYGATGSSASWTSVPFPADTVLLDTRLRYGKISYKKEDVVDLKEGWQPSERHMSHLGEDYRSTPEARVRFISDGYGGVRYDVTRTAAAPDWKKCPPRLTLRKCVIIFFMLMLCLMLLLFWAFGLFDTNKK